MEIKRYDVKGMIARGGTVTAKAFECDTGEFVKYDDYVRLNQDVLQIKRMQNVILEEVACERSRQDKKWGMQNHIPEKWLAILGEEFGEVCKEVCEHPGKVANQKYRYELIQVAAVAVSMVECYDRFMLEKKKG